MNVNKIYSLDEKLKHYLTDFNNKKTYMTMIGLYNKTYGGGGVVTNAVLPYVSHVF